MISLLTFNVRGVSNKHCLLPFFIWADLNLKDQLFYCLQIEGVIHPDVTNVLCLFSQKKEELGTKVSYTVRRIRIEKL